MSYEFQSSLYRTSREFHTAIAEHYMSAGGINDREDVDRFFREMTDAELAREAVAEWGLNDNPDFDKTDFIEAITYLRANVDALFPDETGGIEP